MGIDFNGRVAIVSRHEGRDHRFEMTLFVPNAVPRPAPVFLLLNNRDAAQNTDPSRRIKSDFWPVEQMVARATRVDPTTVLR